MSIFHAIKDNAFVIMMLVGIMQFMFTVLITLFLNRNARNQLRFEVQRTLDSQWQDLNKMLITNPEIQQALNSETEKDKSNYATIRLNLMYYTLNTFQQTIRARSNGFITEAASNQLIEGHIGFFKQMPTEVETLINQPTGFDKAAIEQLKKHWQLAS